MIVFLVGNVLQFQAHSQLAALHTKGLKQRQSASPAGGSSSTARASLQPEPSMRHRAAPAADAGQHTLQKTAVPPAAADAGHDYVIPTGVCKPSWQGLMCKASGCLQMHHLHVLYWSAHQKGLLAVG